VLVLAGIFVLFACALSGITAMAFPMTRDPDVPLFASVAVVGFLAAFALFFVWLAWGVLRGSRMIGERLVSKEEDSLDSLVNPVAILFNALIGRLLSSAEARRWFGLAPK
jgi:hypothetical protein